MPQIDMEPGDYRRDKGWRWRLKWSDPEDNKLPLVMFFVALGMAAIFAVRAAEAPVHAAVACTIFGFGAGGMFMLWMRR